MAQNFEPPSVTRNSFNCPHCGTYTHQHWYRVSGEYQSNNALPFRGSDAVVDNLRKIAKESNEEQAWASLEFAERVSRNEVVFAPRAKYGSDHIGVGNVFISACFTCKAIALWVADELVWPHAVSEGMTPNSDLNPEIQRDFREAALVLDVSPRSAAALLRLCVQKLCVQLGEPGKNINDDIASMVKKGLDVHIQQSLDIVRVVGNEAVHPGEMDLRDDRATALELFELVNLIADARITQPKKVKALYGRLPASKRAGIEARDKP